MTQNSLTTTRRRASARNSGSNKSDTKPSNLSNDNSSDAPPSRIPIKSPARRSPSTSTSVAVGGLAVAYSPIRNSPSTNIFNANANNNFNNNGNGNGNTSSLSTELHSSPSDYARKLLDLKHAMELLKTPPAPQQNNVHNMFSSGGHNHVSYTPIRSSALAHQFSPSFASSIDESLEMDMDITDDSSTINTSFNTTINNTISSMIDNNDTSLLEAYNNDDDDDDDSLSIKTRIIKHNEIFSSPTPNFSSPYLSSEEMKKRLEATRQAFQKSLESQKRRLRSSLFEDDSSSFQFDSDLSIDSLKSTKNQIEKIKKEINELIESDIEEIERINNNENMKDKEINLLNSPPSDSFFATFLKFFIIFSVFSVIFTYLILTYTPVIKTNYFKILEFIQTGNVLDKIEEFLNFLLQDDYPNAKLT